MLAEDSALTLLALFGERSYRLFNLHDGARAGLCDLTVGDFRRAAAATPETLLVVLRPFAEAGRVCPERSRSWEWGTTGLSYGDFIRAAELFDALSQ